MSAMPMTALAGGLAALSMAGLPPTLGFIAKELLYESQLQAIHWPALIVSAAVITNAILAAAGASGVRPFFGKRGKTPRIPHEGPPALVLGPLALAALGLVLGIMPGKETCRFKDCKTL